MSIAADNLPVSVDPTRLRLTNDEGSQGVLLGVRCLDCEVYGFGPTTFCQFCTSDNLDPVEFGQQGKLYSYTIVWVPPPGWPGPVPYVLGQIELYEGPHVLAEIIDCPRSEMKIGMVVNLALQTVKTTEPAIEKVVYKWRPTPLDNDSTENQQ